MEVKLKHNTIILSHIRFPEIQLKTRDAHQLRGFFGNYFKEHSPLLHNHYDDGSLRYKYPLVQYKVIDNVPMLVGFNEGARLLTELFLDIRELKIENNIYPIHTKNISQQAFEPGLADALVSYTFATHWMALNQTNFEQYASWKDNKAKKEKLDKLLVNNILSMFKGLDVWIEGKLMAKGEFKEHSALFKDKHMTVFSGSFVCNANIPEYAGIGKAVSRGFGTITRKP